MPDGFHVPKRIEQGLHAYGELPSEHDISLAKARVLASIEKRKQSPFDFASPRTWVTLAAGVAVVALALTGNELGVFKSQDAQIGQSTQPGATATTYANVQSQKLAYYREKGQTYLLSDDKGTWDLTNDKSSIYFYQNGRQQKILTWSNDIRTVNAIQDTQDTRYVTFTVFGMTIARTDYLLNTQTKELIELPAGQLLGLLNPNTDHVQLVMRDVENTIQKQLFYTYDLKSKQKKTLLETETPYYVDNVHVEDNTITTASQYKISFYQNGEWTNVATSTTGRLILLQATYGEVLYLTNGSELEIYHGNQTIHRYQLATGKSDILLPNVHGDQELLIDDKDLYSGYLISNWEADANTKHTTDPQQQMGTLTIWHVSPSNEAKKITTMKTTYAAHKVQIVQNNNGPIITANEIQLYIGHDGQDYFLNLKTDAFRPHQK